MSSNEEGGGEYKDGPKDTIEVRGPENLINRYKLDLLQLYFESQKDLNGSITDISFDAANAVVVIKFDSEQAAQRIIECPSHVLKGESLKIKLRQNPNFRARSAQTTHAGSKVLVSGLKRIEAKEIVEYYFENKRRSGGGPITSFFPVESDDDTYEITFENTKDAKSVVERRHVINGLSVDVTLLHTDRETEYYQDRFLIKGLPNNTSDEYILCFIKAVTGMKPKFLTFHKKEKDVVLVIMRCDLDIAQLIKHCKEETLEGAKIQIYEVEVSNVIHVGNLPENIHSDTVLLYFENKRKSKGGTVKKVIRLDKASFLVYFEDYKVIESVLGHVHVLQRKDITVRKYFKCVAQTEEEAFSTNNPQTVVIPDLDIRILKFIQQNGEFKHIVEQELLIHNAQVDWPKEGSDSCEVSINCIVDKSNVLSNRVILRWEKDIREVFKFLMDKIYVHCITLIGEFNFDDSCVECTAGNEENTLVFLDRGECAITVVGTSPKIATTLRSQDNFSGDAEEELKVERHNLSHAVEFNMLRSFGYRDKIVKEVPNILIKEREENLAVDFEGYPLDIRNAKHLMLEMKNEYNIVFLYSLTALSSKLYSKRPTVDFVNKSLLSAKMDCIWKVSHQKITVCCLKKFDLETCTNVIKESVMDDVIHQDSDEWCDMSLLETELYKVEVKYLGKVAISLVGKNEIYLCSTKDIRDVIVKEVRAGIQSLIERKHRFEVIDDVLGKEHMLSKQLLDVKRYREFPGRPEVEEAERVLRLPEDLVLKNVDAQKLKFLKNSNANRMAIQTQLDYYYATIVWPEEGPEVILKCTLTNEVKDCFKLIKTWKITAEKNFEDFLKLIIVKKVQILQDIWGMVMEELHNFNIENPEAIAIFVDKNEGVITVAGNKKVAEDLSTKIENMTKVIMAGVEKEREKIKETITSLKNIETRMFLADKYPTEMEKLFQDLKVKINQNKNVIVFEGPLGQVRDAKLKMYELKTRFAIDRSEKISELAAGLLILKQTKEHVVKKLKASRVTAVWDTVEGYLEVYCTSQDQIQLCVDVIRSSVIEHTVPLKKAFKTVVNSEKWQTKVDELHGYHAGKCFIKVSDDCCKVQICATDDIAKEILINVKIFLRQNTVVEAKVTCTKNVHRLIERHHKNEISNIAKGLTNYNVQISSVAEYGGFEVHGTEDGLQQAVQQLQQLLLKVKQKEHIMTKPGLSKHMQTPKGKDNLNTIESMHQCVVAVKGDYDEDEINDNPYESVPIVSDVRVNIGVKGVKIVAYSKVYDCRNVYTMQGDMTELTVDMIVNSADDKLSLTGGLGNAIVKKGGKIIQKECAAYIRENDRLDDGDAFVSTAGSLKADAIVHVRGPVWRGGMKQEDEMLTDAIFKCLQQASTRNLTSVAMPALSCGTYGYPVRKATAVIVAAVKNFFREVQDSTVMDIYLCDMKSNTVEAFNKAMSNEFGATNVKKYVNNLDSIRQPSKRFSRADSDDENPFIKPMDTDEEDDDYYQSSSNLAPPSGKAPPLPKGRPPQKTTKIGNISVSVVKGEIAKQKVDVIVNTTAKNLDLKNGAVSASLLKTGGMELQQEVSKKYPNGIKDGEIAVTSGQSLRCDIVVHSSLANWDGKKDAQCKQALHKLMKDCMDEAENQGKTSIAFPAIGTGNLGFPRDIVATEMFSAVSKFSNSNPSSSLREVSFIVYQKDFQTIQAFEYEARKWSTGKRGATGGREGRQYDMYEDLQGRFARKPSTGSGDEDEENLYESLDDVDGSKDDDGAYKFGSLKILVQQGDITAQNTQCIVNSSNEALDLSRGNVSQAILKKGGKALEKEVDDKRKIMKKEHLVVTSAPGMSCQKIIHVVAKETAQEWLDIIEKCLFKADKEHMKDIAFPALGTGLQMDASVIATTMANAILNFAKTDPKYLKEVRLVIFQKQMVGEFDKVISIASRPNEGWGGKIMRSVKGWLGGGGQDQTSKRQTKKKPAKNQDPNKVTFIVLAMSEKIIDQAIAKLESCLDKEVCSSKFNDSIIKNMNDQQIMEIRSIAAKHHLEIKVETSDGEIQISGISANVSKAADNIHRILRQAVTVEQERKTAELMSNLTQWSYIENGETGQTLKAYDKDLNYKIESAYIAKAANVNFSAGKTKYILDFSKMEEYPEDDPSDCVTVIRRDLVKQGTFEAPALWTDMTGNLRVVSLQAGGQEYNDISQKFTASAGGTFTVVKIERIQNNTLWAQYAAKKKQLEDQNPANTTNERLLWHGTAVDAVDNINAHGFNRSYCGKNATYYGDGVYFAVNANYSCSNTYSRPDPSGVKRVYYCRVLTGEYTQGTKGMRVAPTKGGTGSTAIYDSVVENKASPGMFVIFHDTQAYPEYLIYFK